MQTPMPETPPASAACAQALPSQPDPRRAATAPVGTQMPCRREALSTPGTAQNDDSYLGLPLPTQAAQVLLRAAPQMGQSDGVTITLVRKELTKRRGDHFLMVSRLYTIEELLDTRKRPDLRRARTRYLRLEEAVRRREVAAKETGVREAVMREPLAETARPWLHRRWRHSRLRLVSTGSPWPTHVAGGPEGNRAAANRGGHAEQVRSMARTGRSSQWSRRNERDRGWMRSI